MPCCQLNWTSYLMVHNQNLPSQHAWMMFLGYFWIDKSFCFLSNYINYFVFKQARHMVIPYVPMLVPPLKWTGYPALTLLSNVATFSLVVWIFILLRPLAPSFKEIGFGFLTDWLVWHNEVDLFIFRYKLNV